MEYNEFYNTFLAEMPWRAVGDNSFNAQLEMLRELFNDGNSPIAVGNTLFKFEMGSQTSYWVGTNDLETVNLIVDTETTGNFCKVVLTSKNPALTAKSPPYASEVYLAIKNDIGDKNVSFASDSIMTDDAVRLWARLHSQGNSISVYNTQSKKYELKNVDNSDELKKYVGDINNQQYIFVMSENKNTAIGVKHAVGLIELKRNAGYPLQELFKQLKRKYYE